MPAGERGRSAQRGRGLKGAAASESAALAQLLGCARARWLRPGGGEDKDARKTPGPFFSSPHTHTKETGAQPQQGRQNSPASKLTGRLQVGKRSHSSRQLTATLPDQAPDLRQDQL